MSAPLLQISYTLANIRNAADQFWQYAHQHRIMAFSGEMGAGKTTFIHNLCDMLGVVDAVSSPTFALINEYHFMQEGKDQTIFHMDWYRLRDEDEAIQAGMEDSIMDDKAICFIEWPEKAAGLLRSPYLWIETSSLSPTEREMKVWLK